MVLERACVRSTKGGAAEGQAARRLRMLLGVAGLALFGCAPRPVRLDERSAAGHRAEAEAERRAAEVHRSGYDPDAVTVAPLTSPGERAPIRSGLFVPYNPTLWHLQEGARHLAHARDHERAAVALEAFEEQACAGIPPKARGACPTLGPVAAVEEIPNGVRLTLADPTQVEAVLAHVRCQLAYARARAFEAAACPLTIQGVEARPGDGGTLELLAGSARALAELRTRALALVAAP